MTQTIHLLVPTFNEAANLPRLFSSLLPQLESIGRHWRVLFVDDGSTDETLSIIEDQATRWPISCVRHPRNLGPGAAFVTGFNTLLRSTPDDEPIVTLEADGTSDLRLLPELLSRFDDGADLVLASVYHPAGGLLNTPAGRRFLSSGANVMIRRLFRMPGIWTFSSFYRVYGAGVIRRAFEIYGLRLIEEPGFAAVVELLIRLHRLGIRIEEVPMVLDSAQREGNSRMRIGRTVRAYLRMMTRQRLELTPIEDLVALTPE